MVNENRCFSYIQIEHARVAAVAALAKEHAELRVENCVALGVSMCVFAASRAQATYTTMPQPIDTSAPSSIVNLKQA